MKFYTIMPFVPSDPDFMAAEYCRFSKSSGSGQWQEVRFECDAGTVRLLNTGCPAYQPLVLKIRTAGNNPQF
ncbi:MAG: hypothetical protein E7055_08005 [Lentisphaerae bacterium]|nr:hypothetical protein [Lentisphaerota bacterium]